jgi:signal transduction histidine kinase
VSVRLRLTIASMLLVGAAVVGGAVVLVALLGGALTDQVCAAAQERAGQIAAELSAGRPVPPGSDDELLQLPDAPPPGECRTVEPPGKDEDYAVASATVPNPPAGAPATVVVGKPLVDVLESTQFVTRVLLIGLPALLLLVGGITWYVVGRALAPVAAIRREADQITAAGLDRRVPQPHSTDEIARLATTMNRMLDRLEHALAAQRRFVSDASHELRSPITAIRQHTEVALAHPDSTTLAELADTVRTENLRLQRLVDDLLLLARADESALSLATATVDLDDLVFDEARHLRGTTTLDVDTSWVSAGRVSGDPDALRRILRNLGDNAACYARQRVAFALSERDSSVVLAVSDDGPGIAAADRERVFERFVQLSEAREHGGSGLGLAIVAEVVRAHGGTVRIDQSHLGGVRVEIRLPAEE